MHNSVMDPLFYKQISLLFPSCTYHVLLKPELRCLVAIEVFPTTMPEVECCGGIFVEISLIVPKLI